MGFAKCCQDILGSPMNNFFGLGTNGQIFEKSGIFSFPGRKRSLHCFSVFGKLRM
jgi:hypothetical protein